MDSKDSESIPPGRKVLLYGSHHIIQNSGWATQLHLQPPRRGTDNFRPSLPPSVVGATKGKMTKLNSEEVAVAKKTILPQPHDNSENSAPSVLMVRKPTAANGFRLNTVSSGVTPRRRSLGHLPQLIRITTSLPSPSTATITTSTGTTGGAFALSTSGGPILNRGVIPFVGIKTATSMSMSSGILAAGINTAKPSTVVKRKECAIISLPISTDKKATMSAPKVCLVPVSGMAAAQVPVASAGGMSDVFKLNFVLKSTSTATSCTSSAVISKPNVVKGVQKMIKKKEIFTSLESKETFEMNEKNKKWSTSANVSNNLNEIVKNTIGFPSQAADNPSVPLEKTLNISEIANRFCAAPAMIKKAHAKIESETFRIENNKIFKVPDPVQPMKSFLEAGKQSETGGPPQKVKIFTSEKNCDDNGRDKATIVIPPSIIRQRFGGSSPPNASVGKKSMYVSFANDIFGHSSSPGILVPCKSLSVIPDDITIEIKTSLPVCVEPRHPEIVSEFQTFTYESLCVSSQTLVEVAGLLPMTNREPDFRCRRLEQDTTSVSSKPEVDSVKPSDTEKDDQQGEVSYFAYRCYLCPYSSMHETKVARHWINVHLATKPYRCPHCTKAFSTSYRAQLHVEAQHSDRRLIVGFRQSEHFANALTYEIEKLGDAEYESLRNSIDESEEGIAYSPVSYAAEEKNAMFACKKCEYRSKSPTDLKRHLKSVHLRCMPFFCHYCPRPHPSFNCNYDLRQHVRNFHAEHITLAVGKALPDGRQQEINAEIAWSDSWEAITVAGEQWYQCRRCAFRTSDVNAAWRHVLRMHEWPEHFNCPACTSIVVITEESRGTCHMTCSFCSVRLLFGPSTDTLKVDMSEPVYVCTICEYKTLGRGSMNRHIKYNHTSCRPFACSYCNYVAAEREKVKVHITSHHPDQQFVIKERVESIDLFRRNIGSLFSQLVKVRPSTDVKGFVDDGSADHDSNARSPSPGTNGDDDDDSLEIKPIIGPNGAIYACRECSFITADMRYLCRHRRIVHNLNQTHATYSQWALAEADRTGRGVQLLNGEHFKCKACGYCCVDRSCMSRHVKYMHITSRPHACPYCTYNNVEKTKVRLHVRSHHPSMPRIVKTNQKILEEMSWKAKHFYVHIDKRGREISDLGAKAILDDDEEEASECADDLSEDLMRTMEMQDSILNFQTRKSIGRIVTSSAIKLEPVDEDDDVDLGFDLGPGAITDERPTLHASSISAIDHNYVTSCLAPYLDDADELDSNDDETHIKTEPTDADYEDLDATTNSLLSSAILEAVSTSDLLDIVATGTVIESKGSECRVATDRSFTKVKPCKLDSSDQVSSSSSYIWEEDSDDLDDSEIDLNDTASFSSDGNDVDLDGDVDHNVDEPIDDDITSNIGIAAQKMKIEDINDNEESGRGLPPKKKMKLDDMCEDPDRLKIADYIRNDPKICMRPVIELDDIVQIILSRGYDE